MTYIERIHLLLCKNDELLVGRRRRNDALLEEVIPKLRVGPAGGEEEWQRGIGVRRDDPMGREPEGDDDDSRINDLLAEDLVRGLSSSSSLSRIRGASIESLVGEGEAACGEAGVSVDGDDTEERSLRGTDRSAWEGASGSLTPCSSRYAWSLAESHEV